MFLGHIGVGFAAKRLAPRVPLWLLIVTSMLLDLLFFVFMTFGIEAIGGNITWSHSFSMSIIWSIIVMTLTYLAYHDLKSGLITGLVVFSHWVLDYTSWSTQLPLFFSALPSVTGLGVSNNVILEVIVELSLFTGGVLIYRQYKNIILTTNLLIV